MCGVLSGRSLLGMAGCNVVCQARIPALVLRPEGAVECPHAHLEQQVCPTLSPLHLLTFGEALADHGVHRGFGQT
jgi:hypothetical protein